jgi:hypothetical protein
MLSELRPYCRHIPRCRHINRLSQLSLRCFPLPWPFSTQLSEFCFRWGILALGLLRRPAAPGPTMSTSPSLVELPRMRRIHPTIFLWAFARV